VSKDPEDRAEGWLPKQLARFAEHLASFEMAEQQQQLRSKL
jgi:hypothetical protein